MIFYMTRWSVGQVFTFLKPFYIATGTAEGGKRVETIHIVGESITWLCRGFGWYMH